MRKKPCTHAGAVVAQLGLNLAGVVDANAQNAELFKEMFSIPWSGQSVSAGLDAVQPDTVIVAVPYQVQQRVVREIVASPYRPRRLVLEKPLAADLADAHAILEACRDAGIMTLVNNECGAPVIAQIERILADSYDNEVISISAWCSSGLHAVGIHVLGMLRYLFGPVEWVRAVAETEHVASLPFSTNFTPDDPRVHAMLGFRSGQTGFLTNSALTRYTCKELEVTCRGGRLRLSDNGNRLETWGTAVPGESTVSYRLADPEVITIEQGTVFSRIAGFLASDDETAGQDVLGLDIALDTYRLLDALIASSQANKEVRL